MCLLAQRIEEFAGALHWANRGDYILNLGQAKSMFAQDVQTEVHELIVVGLVARRSLKLGNAARLGERDPNLGDTFQIQANHVHRTSFPYAGSRRWRIPAQRKLGSAARNVANWAGTAL